MNKLISTLIATVLTISTFSAIAATTPENADDASSIGTAESPQHKQQEMRTDKGSTDMNEVLQTVTLAALVTQIARST